MRDSGEKDVEAAELGELGVEEGAETQRRGEGLGATTGIERGGAGDGGSRRARQELGDGGFLLAAPARAYLGERESMRGKGNRRRKGKEGEARAWLACLWLLAELLAGDDDM